MSYTPGPWKVGEKHPCRIIAAHTIVAFACDPKDEETEREEEKANARLIAASPALYDWMKRVLRDPERFTNDELDQAEAIALEIEG